MHPGPGRPARAMQHSSCSAARVYRAVKPDLRALGVSRECLKQETHKPENARVSGEGGPWLAAQIFGVMVIHRLIVRHGDDEVSRTLPSAVCGAAWKEACTYLHGHGHGIAVRVMERCHERLPWNRTNMDSTCAASAVHATARIRCHTPHTLSATSACDTPASARYPECGAWRTRCMGIARRLPV